MHINNYDNVADIYDIYNQADYDIGFFVDRCKGFKGKAVELMAGTGRLSLPLLRSGMDLDCVDISKGLLEQLQGKLDKAGLAADIIQADIRYMNLKSKYELVVVGFNSLWHQRKTRTQ
ncbi:MAG TPA: class I SAM-dependent methyltransferase [Clostridia bacterium]|nr:class I SAM-dependent methyltransferase [Clostridia bacterium]